jgi:hypothetical protein
MEDNVDWLWAFGAPSLSWALYALIRHFVNLGVLVYVFRQELRQPDGNVRSAVAIMKEAAEAVHLSRGGASTPGETRASHRPDHPPGDPPADGFPAAL